MGLIHSSPVGTYKFFPITGVLTTAAVGNNAATTATTAIAGGGASTTVTPAAMKNLNVGDWINVFGGTGTAEYVQINAVTATTFSAVFANAHSGTYNIVTRRGIYVGSLLVGDPGTTVVVTIYNGFPGSTPDTGEQVVLTAKPTVAGYIPFNGDFDRGLFVTVAGTVGSLAISYIDAIR